MTLTFSLFVVALDKPQSPQKDTLDDGTRERTIISHLLSLGYKFMLPREYFAQNQTGKIALLIHDADFKAGGIMTMIRVEKEYGVKSAFYPRPDQDWFMLDAIGFLQLAESWGWEVGFQYDCLSRADGNYSLAMALFENQLSYMRRSFNISTTDYHGDMYNFSINNFDLYNAETWAELGLHELYSLTNYSYYTDTNNILQSPAEPLKDLVIVQLHTDWTAP